MRITHSNPEEPLAFGLGTSRLKVGMGVTAGFRSSIAAYLLVALVVAICLIVRGQVDPLFRARFTVVFLILPVIVAAWRGEFGPTLFATALSLAMVCWFFSGSRYETGQLNLVAWILMTTCALASLLICWYAKQLRRANRRLAQMAARPRAREHARESDQTEEVLSQSEQSYRDVLEGLPQLVWTALPDGSWDY